MSPNSARKAEQLGYTNVKVYHEGMPEWSKRNHTVLTVQYLKEAWIDKDIPHVLLDLRPASAAQTGFIKGAVSLPAGNVEKSFSKLPAKDLKPPVIVYSGTSGDDAVSAAKAINAAGYKNVKVLSGGFDAWKAAAYAVTAGAPAVDIVYVPKPRPGELSIEAFTAIAKATPADALILDVRNRDEGNAGMIKGAMLIPDEELLDRFAEIPKDKKIVTHCSTGVRAEMAYHKLKEKGYNVQFLNAKADIDKDGNFKIEKP
jgi:rhodanese-related sulfurtransferase